MHASRIFISYSHRGNGPAWKAALLRALQVFERQHLLDVWEDGKIRVSSYWEDDIEKAMDEAQVAVVLLTKEALESEFILNKELPRLGERQQREKLAVFPVVCEPCHWRAHDWLRAPQAPNASNPLSELSGAAQEHVFRQLATTIAEELSRAALSSLSPFAEERTDSNAKTYLDKFPLTRSPGLREEKLIGREQELALLDLALASAFGVPPSGGPGSRVIAGLRTAIVSLVAWGGVGKTMLVQHWLQRLQCEGWFGARHVYAWSFYSQGTKEDRQASEDTFLAHALEWFGVQCEPTLSPWDKGRLLADAVARERTLLILDGIEPLQYPPGPMGGQLRAPGVQSLLKQLARKASSDHSSLDIRNSSLANGLCLVTTREPLTDLADFQRREGSPWGSVLRVDLGNLTDEAGAALLHHTGAKRAGAAEIKPDDKELLAASREVDGHALTLNLLGRFLARAHGGDIRRRDLVKFEEADRKEQGGTTFKMLAAFENWFAKSGEFGARQLAVLRMLGLFDRPADEGCIGALREPPVIAGLNDPLFTTKLDSESSELIPQPLIEEDWHTATSFLSDFGLVMIQVENEGFQCALDCHPLVREHFAKQLCNGAVDSWRAAHQRLYEHLCTRTHEGAQPTLEALQPLYQGVFHGCQAGLQLEAIHKVYDLRILRRNEKYTWHQLGAYSSDLGVVACFFERPWDRISPALNEGYRGWVLSNTGYILRALGRLTEALEPMRVGLEMVVKAKAKDWEEAAIRAGNLTELELALGVLVPMALNGVEVDGALADAFQGVSFADRSGDAFQRMVNRCALAWVEHQAGHWFEAQMRFREAEQMQAESAPTIPLLYGTAGFRHCDLVLREAERAAWQKGVSGFGPLGGGCSATVPVRSFVRLARLMPWTTMATLRSVSNRAAKMLEESEAYAGTPPLDIALDHLTLGRAALYEAILESHSSFRLSASHLESAVSGFRRAGRTDYIPCALLTRAWQRTLTAAQTGLESVESDLDEAWDIAERGPMRLHMADIHLYRARLFFREESYPWKSPQDDLAAAEKLINDCGYHRRDEELADAKRAILGGNA